MDEHFYSNIRSIRFTPTKLQLPKYNMDIQQWEHSLASPALLFIRTVTPAWVRGPLADVLRRRPTTSAAGRLDYISEAQPANVTVC